MFRLRALNGYKNISKKAYIERVKFDKVNPMGVYVGDYTLVASGTTILTHEHVYRDKNDPFIPYTTDTKIGARCFIGVNALILPGVTIGDDCVIGAGAAVNKDIPSGCMAVGVPAKIIRTGIKMNDKAQIIDNGSKA
jgi:acetyltransferase-like isoleucine patch superfamily enzyme